MYKNCKKILCLLSYISSFCVIFVWYGNLLPLSYIFLRSAYSDGALTLKQWLHIHLYDLEQFYIPQKFCIYWVFYVMKVLHVDILLNLLSYILFHRLFTQERTQEYILHFCVTLGYFAQDFDQRKRNLLKRRLSPVWERWLC